MSEFSVNAYSELYSFFRLLCFVFSTLSLLALAAPFIFSALASAAAKRALVSSGRKRKRALAALCAAVMILSAAGFAAFVKTPALADSVLEPAQGSGAPAPVLAENAFSAAQKAEPAIEPKAEPAIGPEPALKTEAETAPAEPEPSSAPEAETAPAEPEPSSAPEAEIKAETAPAIESAPAEAGATEPAEAAEKAPAEAAPPLEITGGVTVIGDSVPLGAQAAMQKAITGCFVDGKVSRPLSAGLEILKSLQESGSLGEFAVIALGTNGTHNYAKLYTQIIDALSPGHKLIFVTPFDGRLNKNAEITNDTADWLRELPERYEYVTIADWNALISPQADLLARDKVHMGGQSSIKLYTDCVAAAIGEAALKPAK